MAVKAEEPSTSGNSLLKPNYDRREEWSTVRLVNVPKGTTRIDLEKVFDDFGPVKRCWVLEGKEGEDLTLGFVTFRSPQTAKEVSQLTDLQFQDKVFSMELVPNRKLNKEEYREVMRAKRREEVDEKTRKTRKKEGEIQKARLIVRNLSYKTTDEEFRAHFEQFGELTQSIILRKHGKMVGCGFVQYKETKRAIQAIAKANGKELKGRIVAVDFAVPQYLYRKTLNADDEEPSEVKKEIKEEEEADEDMEVDKGLKFDESVGEEDSEEEEGGEDEEMSEGEESQRGDNEDKDFEGEKPRPEAGHDVDEQKTVFIKNLSFDSDEEDLKDMMEENFGPCYFAKVVMNREMNVSKGTAFVKFVDAKHAAKCVKLAAGSDGIWLDKRQLTILFALKPDDVKAKIEERKKKNPKDKRNLYLAREGLIREGSKAAEGVSKEDMARRRFLMTKKKDLLANLHNFISTTRLVVRNFPAHYTDMKLKQVILKWSPPKSRLQECRIMKNLASGVGESKGYAFVNFHEHEDALYALRNINNNPEIFGPNRRPIVDFSIEDRKALLLKERRAERSKLMNPTYRDQQQDPEQTRTKPLKQDLKKSLDVKQTRPPLETTAHAQDFAGSTADAKIKKLPKHLGEKKKLSRKDLKAPKTTKDRRKIKAQQKKRRVEQEPIRDRPQAKLVTPATTNEKKQKKREKVQRKEENENKKFSNLVSQYKSSVTTNQTVMKKWFE